MNKYTVIWTPQAKRDLRQIQRYIARDAPSTAKAFIERIRQRVRMIGVMPSAGALVLEASSPDVREIYVGSYRIIYRIGDNDVRVIVVMHGAKMLTEDRLTLEDS